jgi:hypothetical protein
MNHANQILPDAPKRAELGLYIPPASEVNVAHWKINGYRASIIVWTAEEWANLPDRPTDAQFYPCGIWCALRVD